MRQGLFNDVERFGNIVEQVEIVKRSVDDTDIEAFFHA